SEVAHDPLQVTKYQSHVRPRVARRARSELRDRHPLRRGCVVSSDRHTRAPARDEVEVQRGKPAEAAQVIAIEIEAEIGDAPDPQTGFLVQLAPRALLHRLSSVHETTGYVHVAP